MHIDEKKLAGFSMLEMSVTDEEDLVKVIFMGRWLVDCVNEPSVTHPEMNRYTVALTPTNSYFVFWEPLDLPALRRYEVYDCFEWMEESLEVPKGILKAISKANTPGPAEVCGTPDA